MEGTRKLISTSKKRRSVPKGSGNLRLTEQVVYRIEIGKNAKGKTIYDSTTRHELING